MRPLYSKAMTAADDQATTLWFEAKDESKPTPFAKNLPLALSTVDAPPGTDFDDLINGQAIDNRFASHHACLLRFIVMAQMAHAIEDGRGCTQKAGKSVRSGVGVIDRVPIVLEMILHNVPVIGANSGRRDDKNNSFQCPAAIHVHGKGPNPGLVMHEIPRHVAQGGRIRRRSGSVGQLRS